MKISARRKKLFRLLIQVHVVAFIFMLNTVFMSAWSIPDWGYRKNKRLVIVTMPDHSIISWKHADKFKIDFSDTGGWQACNSSTCPAEALNAGAAKYKIFTDPDYGIVVAYYNSSGTLLGTGTDHPDLWDVEYDNDIELTINTAGAFSVAPNGAASYSFPIQVPPGIAGMAPKLSLNYNSQAGNGLLGLGWSLGGLSSIHRCPSTVAQDGTADGVDFDSNDKFCLDGQRLMATSGSYGADASQYRTEVDAFTKVIASDTPLSGTGSFEVKTPTGEVMEYGVTSNSRIMAEGKSKAYIWALNKVTDSAGNRMNFTYTQNSANSEYRLTRIDYAYSGGTSHAHVEFEYSGRDDVQTTYMAGSEVRLTKLLTRIYTYSGSSPVMRYTLNYDVSPVNGRKRLVSIVPCSLVNGSKCLEPATFEWQGDSEDATDVFYETRSDSVGFDGRPHWIMDTDGDGKQELLYNKTSSDIFKYVGQSSGSWGEKGHHVGGDSNRQWTLDVNGDGLMDFLYQRGGTEEFWVLRNLGDGSSSLVHWGTANLYSGLLQIEDRWPVDINGDGRTDLLYTGPTGNYRALIAQSIGTAIDTAVGSRTYELGMDNAHFTIDVNGDGATDLVYNRADTFQYRVLINNRNNTFTDQPWTTRAYNADYNYAHWPLDANGDGLVDLVYKRSGGEEYRVMINKGDGTAVDQIFGYQNYSAGWDGRHWVLDVNADGIMDLVYNQHGTDNYRALISQADGSRSNQQWAVKISSVGFSGNHWPADVDGDGLSELVYNVDDTSVYRKLGNNSSFDLIDRITDGFGNATSILYAPLSSGGVAYTRTESGYNDYPNNLIATGAMQVVSQVTTPNGIGGTRSRTYDYENFRISREGRGMLGFRKMVEEDTTSKNVKTTRFLQSFPFSGMPDQILQEVRLPGGGKVLFNRQELQYEDVVTVSGKDPVFVYPEVTEEFSYHFNNATSTSSLLATTTTTNSNLDSYGNFETVTVEIENPAGTQKYKTVTASEYANYTSSGKWILGRLTRAQVTKYVNNATDANSTTVTAFEYDTNTGLLKKEIIEPDRGVPYRKVTAYDRDSYGNITTATVCASDFGTSNGNCTPGAAGPSSLPYRTTVTDYDNRGQFPETVTNALGQSETYLYEPKFGQMAALTGPNLLTTHWTYDVFGRKTGETRADGSSTAYEYEWCVSGCPSGAKYFIESTDNGIAPVREYFDKFDRKLRTRTLAFDGGAVYVDTVYNALGQTQKVSEPYFAGATVYWTESTYDLVGRIIEVDPPAGPTVTTAYNGLSNTTSRTVNGSARTETETKNVAGQTVSVTNAAGTVLTYSYDSQGNLTDTQVQGRSDTLIQVDFDIRGRKIAMDDPDMGEWSYAYNGYGELVSQTNALSQTVTMSYDKLGRLVQRVEPEGTSTWTYGTVFDVSHREVGKLVQVKGPGNDFYTRDIEYDSLGRTKSETVTLNIAPYLSDREYITSMTYYASGDHIGKLEKIRYPEVGASRFEVKNHYNSYGYLETVTSADGSITYWEGIGTNARGQFTAEALGDHVLTTRTYDTTRGWTKTIQSVSDASGVGTFQSMQYEFDDVGNIEWRKDHRQNLTENFLYDTLDQLTDAWVVGGTPSSDYVAKEYSYDALGNIKFKTGVGHYKYGSACGTGAGPHAVCEIRSAASGGTLLQSYAYNANGSMFDKDGGPDEAYYTSFNKPYQFDQGGTSVVFHYGTERERVFKVSGVTKTAYIGMGDTGNPLYEHEMTTGLDKHLHFIYAGGQALGVHTVEDNGSATTSKTEYLHRDHLGSVEVVTANDGTVAARMSYDAWGQQRDPDWSEPSSGFAAAPGNLGFTGHENIPERGLVHMNGRVYDPALGKFLSADPNVQFSKDVRSYNRYSYVSNNPLRYTDPTGYFLKKLLQNMPSGLATFISIVLNFVPYVGPALSMIFNAMYASANGATNGQIAFSMALSAAGNAIGGEAAGTYFNKYDQAFQYSMVQASVSGAFAGGVNAAVADTSISRGVLQGAAMGAALSAVSWKIKQSVTDRVANEAVVKRSLPPGGREVVKIASAEGTPLPSDGQGSGTSQVEDGFKQCFDACLKNNYGESYEVAKELSPLSVASVVTNEVSELIETKLERDATRKLYGNSKDFDAGRRQLKTLAQFRKFNAGMAVIGAGALGFQAGAWVNCSINCVDTMVGQ